MVVVDNVEEVRDVACKANEGEEVLCITGVQQEEIIRDFVQMFNIKPGNLTCRNELVDGFSINGARVRRALPGDIVGDQPDDRGVV